MHKRVNPQLILSCDFMRDSVEHRHPFLNRPCVSLRFTRNFDSKLLILIRDTWRARDIFCTIFFNILFELDAGIGSLGRLWLVGRHSYRMLMHLALYHLPTEGCMKLFAANMYPFFFENDKTRAADNNDGDGDDGDDDDDDDDDNNCISGRK